MNQLDALKKAVSAFDLDIDNNPYHKTIFDKIVQLVNTPRLRKKIRSAFHSTIGTERFTEESTDLHLDAIREILIGNLTFDYDGFIDVLESIENGTAIDINELSKPLNSLNNVFYNENTIKVFDLLKMYGIGQHQKGPGEYALAFMSPRINLAVGVGDLEIEGIGKVELKMATGKSGGGRLGSNGPIQDQQLNTLMKFADRLPSVVSKLERSSGGSIGINSFIQSMNEDLPPKNKKNRDARRDIAFSLIGNVFEDKYAWPIAQMFEQDNAEQIVFEYVRQNFNWYKSKEHFDAYLAIGLARGKTFMGQTGDDIIELRKQEHLTGFAISIIPTKSAPREQFSQISLSSKAITHTEKENVGKDLEIL